MHSSSSSIWQVLGQAIQSPGSEFEMYPGWSACQLSSPLPMARASGKGEELSLNDVTILYTRGMASSSTLMPSGLAYLQPLNPGSVVLCCQGAVHGLLQQVRSKTISSSLMTTLLLSAGRNGSLREGEGAQFSVAHVSVRQTSGKAISSMFIPLGSVYLFSCHQGQVYCASHVRCWSCSPECCSYLGAVPALLIS